MNITLDINGTEGVPVTMELIFRKGGSFAGVQPHSSKADAFFFNAPEATYKVGSSSIHFGPGKLQHKAIQLRGALPAMEAPTVYLTGFTPFKHTLTIS